jgi:alpha,alpha-trehalase
MSQPSIFYIESLSPLYEAVQSSGIFLDGKYFVDAIPIGDTANIVAAYTQQKQSTDFSLLDFVKEHFILPTENESSYTSGGKTLYAHIEALWDELKRTPGEKGGTLIPLPYESVVPGGRFRELYYWDSYFTMLGLQVSRRTEMIEDMVDNFAWMIDNFGFVPNGNRSYYLGRSQPPFFSLMLTLLMEEKGRDALLQYRSQLEKEYSYWMDGADSLSPEHPTHRRVVLMPDGSVLNRYWDDQYTPRPEAFLKDTELAAASDMDSPTLYRHIRAAAESGWDFSSRWFRDGKSMETIQTTDIIPIDLNCLLLFLEIALCTIYENQDHEAMEKVLKKLMLRNRAIDTYCWNKEKGFYFDYHFKDGEQTNSWSLAGVFPLFFNIASTEQATSVAGVVLEKFLQPGGLITTLTTSGQQWDAPNGWAPLQWISYKAFQKNGHTELAGLIRNSWMRTNEKVYAATGKMMEKYNVVDLDAPAGGGEYQNQDGFGWTNGVYLALSTQKQG